MYRNSISRTIVCKNSILCALLISCFWIAGFLLGSYYGLRLTDKSCFLLHNAVYNPASFFSLYLVLFSPFILSTLLIRSHIPFATLLITFTKALSFGFCACGTVVAFSSAGWLIRSLLLFSDSIIVVLLLWFWIRNIAHSGNHLNADISICAVFTFTISCIDYFAVSPFLDALLNM